MFRGQNYFTTEIRDKEFVDEVISVLLNSNDSEIDDEIKYILKKIIETEYLDIAIPNTEIDGLLQREILYHIINSILQNKPISVIREELLSNNTLSERVEYILNNYKVNKKISHYINPLKNKIKLLSLYKFLIKIGNRITGITNDIKLNSDFDSSVYDIIENINTLYKEINFDKVLSEVSLSDMSINQIKSFLTTYIDISQNSSVIRSGISILDNLFNLGGFYKGNIYMFSAPYGTGKTRFLTILGGNIFLQGYNVLHITIENEKEEVMKLYNNFIMQMDDNEIIELMKTNGIEFVANEIKDRFSKVKEIYKNNLELKKIAYKSTPKDIENIIISKEQKPDVILIDHVDLLYGDKSDTDLFRRMEDVMSELKNMCEKYKVCIIVASQLNREGSKGRKDLSFVIGDTVSRSIAKNELTSFHAILMQTFEESVNNYIRIFIDKNRFGIQNVMFPLYFDKGRLYIEEILTEEDFEKYISSLNLFQNNKTSQRVINAMKMFISTMKLKLNGDLYSFKNRIMDTYKEISNSISEEENDKINDNQINKIENEIKDEVDILEEIDNETDIIIKYENKEYNYEEFINLVQNQKTTNKTNESLNISKNITGLVNLINEGINIQNNKVKRENAKSSEIKNHELSKENENIVNSNFSEEIVKKINISITFEEYIYNYCIKNIDNKKNNDWYEFIDGEDKKIIKLKIDKPFNLINIDKELIENLNVKYDFYYGQTKMNEEKISKEEFFLTQFLLNGLNHKNLKDVLKSASGTVVGVIGDIGDDDVFLELNKILYVNNSESMYEAYEDIIKDSNDLSNDELLNLIEEKVNDVLGVYLPKNSALVIVNNNIYVLSKEVKEMFRDTILEIYEKYKNMDIKEFYKHYKNNIKLFDVLRYYNGHYPFISLTDEMIDIFIKSLVSLVYGS